MRNNKSIDIIMEELRKFSKEDYVEITNRNSWIGKSLLEIALRQGSFFFLCIIGTVIIAINVLLKLSGQSTESGLLYSMLIMMLICLIWVLIDSVFSMINLANYSQFSVEKELEKREKEIAEGIYHRLRSNHESNEIEIGENIQLIKNVTNKLLEKAQVNKEIDFFLIIFFIVIVYIFITGLPNLRYFVSNLSIFTFLVKFINEYATARVAITYTYWISILDKAQLLSKKPFAN